MAALAALGAMMAPSASGQTTDTVFAGWRWAPEPVAARSSGLGGAFVAVADGVNAIEANPSGIATIPESEAEVTSARLFAIGHDLRRVSIGAYAANVDREDEATGGRDRLASSVWDAGVTLAATPIPRLRLGATGAWSHLHLEGGARADSAHFKLSTGALLTLVGDGSRGLPSLRLGVSYQPGFDWFADTPARASVVFRRPSTASLGLAWRPSDRWLFSAQGDLVRYREIVDALRRNVGSAADGFGLSDAVEPRVGAEFGQPLSCGCGIVKVRGGLYYAAPGTLAYDGPDPSLARAFGRDGWRTVASAGASFLSEHFGQALRLDVDAGDVFHGPDLSVSVVWRFGGL